LFISLNHSKGFSLGKPNRIILLLKLPAKTKKVKACLFNILNRQALFYNNSARRAILLGRLPYYWLFRMESRALIG
jgi:hypothetical protein